MAALNLTQAQAEALILQLGPVFDALQRYIAHADRRGIAAGADSRTLLGEVSHRVATALASGALPYAPVDTPENGVHYQLMADNDWSSTIP